MVRAEVPFLTKVLVPSRPRAAVRRQRLLNLLHRGIGTPLTVLAAGPGYGKTTLLAEFAAELRAPICWLSLDDYDADPRTFLSYLLAAVRQKFPKFGRRSEALLREQTVSTEWLRALAGALNTELTLDLPGRLVLVLDDAHALDEHSGVWQVLDHLLTHPPEESHLILAGRVAPPLRTLPRLLARGQASALSTDDLRFTDEEVRELLAQRYGDAIPEEALRRARECEGWAAGLVLSGLAPAGMSPRGADDRQWLFGYLAAEVLEAQDATTRDFLLTTSVLPELIPEECDALLCRNGSERVLGALASVNPFVTPLGEGERRYYRYHTLFHEFLSDHLRKARPDQFHALHCRAAGLAMERRDWARALYHSLALRDGALLADILEQGGDELYRLGRWAELQRALGALEPERVQRSAALLLLRGRIRLRFGEPPGAAADARAAEALARSGGDERHQVLALSLHSFALRLQGKCSEALNLARQAAALAAPLGEPEPLAEATKQVGISYGVMGDLPRSIAALKRSLELFAELADPHGQASVTNELGMAFLAMGDLTNAEDFLLRAERAWRKLGNQVALSNTLNNLGMVAYYRGEYARALEAMRSAHDAAAEIGYARLRAYPLASMGDVYRDGGDLTAAAEAYASAAALAEEAGDSFLTAYLVNCQGELRRLRGDLSASIELSRRALELAEARSSAYEQGVYLTSLAIAQAEGGELEQATESIEQACRRLAGCGAKRELARARFHRAAVLFAARANAAALEELDQAASLVAELGYDGFLLPDVQRAPFLVQYAASKGAGGVIVQRWAGSVRGQTQPYAVPRASPAERATPRVEAFGLGQSLVRVGDRTVSALEWRSAGSRELFFFLLSQGGWTRRDEIIEALWPDLDPERGARMFHSNAYRLRRALFADILQHEAGRFRVNPEVEVWFDAAEFERLVSDADRLPPGAERAARYRDAIAVYKGPFLEEFYSDWCETLRRRLATRFMHALTRLAEYLMERGEHRRAADLWERALAVDCFDEEALRKLMLCLSQSGNRPAALRHYRVWAEMARREQVEPSAQTERLYQAIASGRDELAAAARS